MSRLLVQECECALRACLCVHCVHASVCTACMLLCALRACFCVHCVHACVCTACMLVCALRACFYVHCVHACVCTACMLVCALRACLCARMHVCITKRDEVLPWYKYFFDNKSLTTAIANMGRVVWTGEGGRG